MILSVVTFFVVVYAVAVSIVVDNIIVVSVDFFEVAAVELLMLLINTSMPYI